MKRRYVTKESLREFGSTNRIPFKTAHTIDRVFCDIESSRFDQDSIEILLINSRDYFKSRSTIAEISNFIAHPRRDRGFISEDVERQINLISSSFNIRIDEDNNVVLPKPWYKRLKKYYRTIDFNKKMIDKIDKIFYEKGEEYITEGILSDYTRERIADAVEGVDLPNASIYEKHLLDDIKSFFKKIGPYEKRILDRKVKEEIITCILCSLHGCEFESEYGGRSVCFLGFDENQNIQLRANLDPNSYADKEDKMYDKQLFSYPIVDTNIQMSRFLDYDLEKEYRNNMMIENSVNPIYAKREKNNQILNIEREKIFSIEEMKIADPGI